MAVSMNSGFMRSDFMISDAALPMRMEELEQLEQTQKFAELLGGIGNDAKQSADTAEAAPVTEVTAPDAELSVNEADAKVTVIVPKSELKKLAQAVIKGEIKLDELPEELVSDVLLMAIAMIMLGVPEDDIAALKEDYTVTITEAEADAMSQFAEVITVPKLSSENMAEAQQPMTAFEIPEELRSEVQAVINKIVNAEAELSDNNEMQADNAEEVAQTDSITEMPLAAVIEAADEVVQSSTDVSVEKDVEVKTAVVEATAQVTADNVQSIVTGSDTAQQSDILPQQSSASDVQTAQVSATEQPALNEEFEQLRKVISQVTVRKTETQQSTSTVQTYTADEQMRNRVVSKSDELALLKNAANPVQQSEQTEMLPVVDAKPMTAQAENTTAETVEIVAAPETAQADLNTGADTDNGDAALNAQQAAVMNDQQAAAPEAPVVFTRADGTEITVKRDEVIRQVVTNVVEQTTNAEGDTEYSITLEPHDLGSITVRMTKTADGTFTVSITAENARTQRIIEESGMALQNSLKQNGIELESWQTVNESEQQERAEDYNGSSKNPYYQEEQNENEDAEDTSFAEMISAM